MQPLSPRNPRVQAVRRLARQSRHRADRRAFVVEGPVLVVEALLSALTVETVFVAADADDELIGRCREAGVDVVAVTDDALAIMATTVTPQPAVAVVEQPAEVDLGSVNPHGHVVVLDALQDPGNAGTILRSAEASGASLVVFGSGSVDAFAPKVVRASAGSILRMPVWRGEAASAISRLRAAGRQAWGTAADGSHEYDRVDLRGAVIVVGNEANGVGPATAAALDGTLRIPQAGSAESLNVAMATTVLCFEAARQRRVPT